eukprot:1425504-Amphidinium_carterae.1
MASSQTDGKHSDVKGHTLHVHEETVGGLDHSLELVPLLLLPASTPTLRHQPASSFKLQHKTLQHTNPTSADLSPS